MQRYHPHLSYLVSYVVKKGAPSWEANVVLNGEIKKLSSKDLLGKYSILLFYPLDLYNRFR